jgi:hypothetical protein
MQVSNFDRSANPRCYSVVGRLLFVRTQSSQLSQLLERLFAGWQLTPVDVQDQQPQIVIDCHVGENVVSISPGLERFEIAEQAQCYLSDDGLIVDFESSLLQLSGRDPVQILIAFKNEPASIDVNLSRTLSFAVCAGLRRHGIFELHSAGLVGPHTNSGVVIIGPSGSGKSTLTTQLAASGWKYLSDDELLLTVEQDQVVARGFRDFFALSAEAMAASGVVFGGAISGDAKTRFEPVAVFGQKAVESVIPRALIFTSISGKVETQVVELSQTETMSRLLRACPWATYDREIARENLKVLSHLARQSAGFDLVAGRDLLAPGYADEFLKSIIKA